MPHDPVPTDPSAHPSPQGVAEARRVASLVTSRGNVALATPEAIKRTLATFLAATAPVEPSGDLVETLSRVFTLASVGAMLSNRNTDEHGEPRVPASAFDAGIRAVLTHLAALGMGEVGTLPDEARLARMKAAADKAESDYAAESFGIDGAASWIPELAPMLLQCVRQIRSVAPVFAAMAERVRGAEAENAHWRRAVGCDDPATLELAVEQYKRRRGRGEAASEGQGAEAPTGGTT